MPTEMFFSLRREQFQHQTRERGTVQKTRPKETQVEAGGLSLTKKWQPPR